MWILKQLQDGTIKLFFDKSRRFNPNLRGSWEYVGQQGSIAALQAIRVNQRAGYLCCNDNEGGVRVLVLED